MEFNARSEYKKKLLVIWKIKFSLPYEDQQNGNKKKISSEKDDLNIFGSLIKFEIYCDIKSNIKSSNI